MKKKFALIMVTMLAVGSLAGCGSGNSSNRSSASSDSVSGDTASVPLDKKSYMSGIDVNDYVELGEYKGLEVSEAKPSVSDELVNMYINYYFVSGLDKVEVTDRPVEEGDTVNIDYAGTLKETGEAFDGGTATGTDLVIGSGSFIDGFEDGLIGKKKGDKVDLNLTFPDPYEQNADLAGKDVTFSVTINKISETPELTDDLVPSFGIDGVSTVDDLKTYMHDSLMQQQQSTYDSDIRNQLIDAAEANCVFQTPPESMISRFTIELNNSLKRQADYYTSSYGSSVTTDDVLKSTMSNEGYSGDADSYMRKLAINQSNMFIMLTAIAEKENITMTDDEISSVASSAVSNNGYSTVDAYSDATGMDMDEVIKEEALAQKVMEFLQDNAVITEPAKEETSSSAASAESGTEASDTSAEAGSDASAAGTKD